MSTHSFLFFVAMRYVSSFSVLPLFYQSMSMIVSIAWLVKNGLGDCGFNELTTCQQGGRFFYIHSRLGHRIHFSDARAGNRARIGAQGARRFEDTNSQASLMSLYLWDFPSAGPVHRYVTVIHYSNILRQGFICTKLLYGACVPD